jgi:hypothetical protein
MSSTRQAVTRGPSFTGIGNRPAFTPAHQVLRPTGKTARTVASRTKPTSGKAGGFGSGLTAIGGIWTPSFKMGPVKHAFD